MNLLFKRVSIGIGIIVVIIFAVMALAALLLPSVLPELIKNKAEERDILFTVEEVNIHWFKGVVEVNDIALGQMKNKQPQAKIAEVVIDVDMRSLLSGELAIENFRVDEASLPIAIKDGKFYLAGINPLSLTSAQPQSETTKGGTDKPLVWRLERARLNNIAAQLDLNGHQIPLNLDELNTGAIDSRQLHKGTPINLLLMAHEAELDLAIQVATLGDRFKINGAVSLHDFKIERWLPTAAAADITLPSSIKEAKGDIRLKTNMNISLNDSIPDIVLNNISVALSEVKLPALSEYLSVIIDADITTEEIQYRVNQLSLAGLTLNSKNIHLTESSTEPAADIRFSELTLTTDRFYLHQPEHGTHLILQTKLGEYGSLNINGRFSASNEPDKSRTLNTKGTVKVDQLDLVPFSGYAKRYLGRHIDSGALNLDIDTQIEADNINASVRIEAHQLYLGGEYHTTDSSILDELGMPLNTALSLLRDSDETITLTLPLKGDMDNPQLKIGSIVNKALLNATKSVLITQLGPLAVISAASKTLDFADSLKLKPILFAAASAEVGSTEQEKLDALKNLLIKRPSLKVTICGYAVTTDIMGREAQPQPEQLNEAQTREQALTLARQRGEIVKQTLVKEGVESKQLIACAGKIDKTANALPRVALSF